MKILNILKLDKRFVTQKRLSKKNIQKRSFVFWGFFHQKIPSLHQKNAFFLQNNLIMNRGDLTFLVNKSYSITLQSFLAVPYIVREVLIYFLILKLHSKDNFRSRYLRVGMVCKENYNVTCIRAIL